jgi:hypothetical protein
MSHEPSTRTSGCAPEPHPRSTSQTLVPSQSRPADTGQAGLSVASMRLDIELASAALLHSMDVLADAVTGSRDMTYTRSSAIFDRVAASRNGPAP